MKRHYLVLILLIICSVSAMAQRKPQEKDKRGFGVYLGADRDTIQYVVASPFDNWYFHGGIGAQTYIGNEYEDSARFNLPDYSFYAEIGKWVIPDVAVALNLSWYGMHGQTRYGPNPWVDFTNTPVVQVQNPEPQGYYSYEKFKIRGISFTGLVYMEWTNLLNGYENGEDIKLHVLTPVGLGFSMLYGGQVNPRGFSSFSEGALRRNFELHFMTGLSFEYRVTQALTFQANATLKVARGSLDYSPMVSDQSHQSGTFDYIPAIQFGARFNMIKRVTKVDPRTGESYSAVVRHQFMPANTERITYLESRIDTLVVQMEDMVGTDNASTVVNLAAVRSLNQQLDSLQHILSVGGNDNTVLLSQLKDAQAEIAELLKKLEHGNARINAAEAKQLVSRQLSRQDSLDLLAGRLARLQSDLARDLGNPGKIKDDITKILDQRDRILDQADQDNYAFGIDDEMGLFSPLDASQTAYRHSLYGELLAGLYGHLGELQKALDGQIVDPDAVSRQAEIIRADVEAVTRNLTQSGSGLTPSQLEAVVARQRDRRDSISLLTNQITTLQGKVFTASGTYQTQYNEDLKRMREELSALLDRAQQDNRTNHIDNEKGTLSAYVAAQSASEQASIRKAMDHVEAMLNDAQTGLRTGNLDVKDLMSKISGAQSALDSVTRSVDVGAWNLTNEEAQELLSRQQLRSKKVDDFDRQIAALQLKLEKGEGNPEELRVLIKDLTSQRQDVLDQAEDDNVNHGVNDDHGRLSPFDAAQLAAKYVGYRHMVESLDHNLEQLQGTLDSQTASDDQVREKIAATKKEIDNINKNIGDNNTGKTPDQLKEVVSKQMARQDSIAYIERRIASLNKRFERGSGDPRQISAEITKLKNERDALLSQSKKLNAENRIDNVNNSLSPLVAAQSAYDQTNLRNRLGYIRSMLDAILRNLGGQSAEDVVLSQIASIQTQIDSVVVAGNIEGAGLRPEEADALVKRQQARQDSITDIDHRLRQLQRQLNKGQGDPEELAKEIESLKAQRNELLADAENDNRTHGVRKKGENKYLELAIEAAAASRKFYQIELLTSQLDSLRTLLDQERIDADPMAQINEAILQLDLPMARVYYQLDRSELDYNARKVLHDFALRLKRSSPDLKYYIIGAADAQTGTDARNMALSQNRCKAVYDVLVHSYGVPDEQLEMYPLGGITEFEDQENNRTAIIVLSNHEITKIIEKWNLINEEKRKQKQK